LGELLERWFAASEPNWAATTIRNTGSIIDCQLKPKLRHVLVRELQTVMIDDFYASLGVNGAAQGAALSRGSVLRVDGVFHRALAQAVRWEWIWSNPATTASPPRLEAPEMRPPSPDEMIRLLDHVAADQPLVHLFLVLAATSGARRGQLLALRWKDVDFEHESLSFQRALVEGPNGPILAPTKTRRCHRVALDSYSQRLLTEQADQREFKSGSIPTRSFLRATPSAMSRGSQIG
jgi:integrase